jgi:hypothetical protein
VVEVADAAKWNQERKKSSLPVGLLGLVDDSSISWLFDDSSFVKRNQTVQSLLEKQRTLIATRDPQSPRRKLSVSDSDTTKSEEKDEEDSPDSDALWLNNQLEEEFHRYTEECKTQVIAEKQRIAELQRELQRLQGELEETKKLSQGNLLLYAPCMVCQKEKREFLLVPCNHLCVCSACVRFQKECPKCKGPVNSIREVLY